MGAACKSTDRLCTLSEIYSSLSQLQQYAVAVDTLDYMFDSKAFVKWYFSDYAQITISVLQDLFHTFVIDVDRVEAIRVVYAVERAIEKSRWLLKDKAESDLDFATVQALREAQSEYRKLRPRFIHIMKCWFEAQA